MTATPMIYPLRFTGFLALLISCLPLAGQVAFQFNGGPVLQEVEIGNLVQWQVSGGQEGITYSVQSSRDGENYRTIGTVDATRAQEYTFLDLTLGSEPISYQVVATNPAGRSCKSPAAGLRRKGANAFMIRTWSPIEVRTELHITILANASMELHFSVLDEQETERWTERRRIREGENPLTFDLSGIPDGMMHFKVSSGVEVETLFLEKIDPTRQLAVGFE